MRTARGPVVKAIDDDIRFKRPDHPNHVGQDLLPVPDPQGFIRVLRIAKVIGPREKLLSPVHPTGRQKFLRAKHAEQFPEFRADQVLPPVAPGHGKVAGSGVHVVGQVRNQTGIFIIRMGRNIEGRPQEVEFFKIVVKRDRRRGGGRLGSDKCGQQAKP